MLRITTINREQWIGQFIAAPNLKSLISFPIINRHFFENGENLYRALNIAIATNLHILLFQFLLHNPELLHY